MSTKKNIPTKKLKHVYDSMGIYDAIYNRHLGYKMGEAGAFAAILHAEEKVPKSVLELFASSGSRHKEFLSIQYKHWDKIKTYKGLDSFAPPEDENVIAADAGYGDFGEKFDVILGFFYTASSAVDPNSENANITIDHMKATYENVVKHLNPGGIFIFDSAIDGYRVALANITGRESSDEYSEHDIPIGGKLRDEAQAEGITIEDKDSVKLKFKTEVRYNRLTANVEDRYSNMKLMVNGKARLRFKIEQPFCQQYFSEPEVVRMLLESGFEDIDFWGADYVEDSVYKMDKILYADHYDEDDDGTMFPNIFVARAPK